MCAQPALKIVLQQRYCLYHRYTFDEPQTIQYNLTHTFVWGQYKHEVELWVLRDKFISPISEYLILSLFPPDLILSQ